MTHVHLPLPLWQLSARRPLGAFFVSMLVAFALGVAALMGCQGCSSTPALVQMADAAAAAKTPRDQARATIVILTLATREADVFCASHGKQTANLALLDRCHAAYDIARPALLTAEAGVDAWDTGARDGVACATAKGAAAAEDIAGDLRHAGADVPAALTDGLRLYATFMAGTCPKDGGL